MYAFDFVKPATLAEAVAALATPDAKALGGGQTFIPTLKQRLASPSIVVSLTGIAELRGIRQDGDTLVVGGAATHADIMRQTAYPALADMARHIGDPAVRNRGTMGGSLANNDPSACYPAAVLASNATIHTNTRTIPADDYFQGMFTTALQDGEIITAVAFPIPQRANYQKFVQPASRFALTAVFVARYDTHTRVAITGAAEQGVFRWTDAEGALTTTFSPDAVAPLTPSPNGLIHDIHATPTYRASLIKTLTKRAVEAAA